jgi:hypothetical protein
MENLAPLYYRCTERTRTLLDAFGFHPKQKPIIQVTEKPETIEEVAKIMEMTPEQITHMEVK